MNISLSLLQTGLYSLKIVNNKCQVTIPLTTNWNQVPVLILAKIYEALFIASIISLIRSSSNRNDFMLRDLFCFNVISAILLANIFIFSAIIVNFKRVNV